MTNTVNYLDPTRLEGTLALFSKIDRDKKSRQMNLKASDKPQITLKTPEQKAAEKAGFDAAVEARVEESRKRDALIAMLELRMPNGKKLRECSMEEAIKMLRAMGYNIAQKKED